VEADASFEFSLPAKPENVALVRHALSGLADVLGMEPEEIADLKTVVTEACSNVVTHAYEPGEIGPLEVVARPEDGSLVVTVADYGRGIRPLADVERRSLRLGIPLIAALSDGFEIGMSPGGGTTVTMRIRLAPNGDERAAREPGRTQETRIEIGAGEALSPVLGRVISMLATRADFSVDRLSDAVLLSDAISAGGPQGFPNGTVRLAVKEEAGAFELRIGPLTEGGGERLLEGMQIPGLEATLEALAEEVQVERGDAGEHVRLRISAAG